MNEPGETQKYFEHITGRNATMPEPTLNELRQMATHLYNLARDELAEYEFEDHDDPDLRSHIESRIAVMQAFLALTDPTPLTAEHCREAGLAPFVEESRDLECAAAMFCMCNPDETPHLEVFHPTRGQLRLALMMEDGNGE